MNIRNNPKTYTYRIENKQAWEQLHKKKEGLKINLDEAITQAIKEWVNKK